MRTLTQPELNRALLARQMLLERVDAPIPAVLERMGALQAQYAPSTYVGLWSRVRGLERAAVTAALEERAIVQRTLLRRTIHVVSRADYWPFARAPREERRTGALRDPTRTVTAREMSGAARKLRTALRGTMLRRTEIEEIVGARRAPVVGLWEDLVRVPPSGTWERRRADLYALAPAPVRFLPTYDATLLVHARRTLILPEEHRPRVFHTRLPQSVPTFLVDGAVAGSWRFADGRVELEPFEPFEPLDADTRRAGDDEAGRLAAFHA